LVNKEYKNMVIALGPFNETVHLKTGKFNNTKTIHAHSPSEDKDGVS
jgi:hypothetical protein